MTTIGTIEVNSGRILDIWFELDQFKETVVVTEGTSGAYVEDDKTGQRLAVSSTGEQVTLNPVVSYSPTNSSISFNFSSDNPTEIDVAPDGLVVFMVEPEQTSSATITITATSGTKTISRNVDVTLNLTGASVVDVIEGGVAGSARKALSDPLDNALVGADSNTQQLIYTSQNHIGGNYVRNTNFLLQGTHAEALTCVSPWNSRQNNKRSGTAVTPRHVVLAGHYPLYIGDTMRFVASDNTVITRTVVQADDVLYNGINTDAYMVMLDSDLPSSITPCKLFPSNYETYLPAGLVTNAAQALPLLATDFEEKGIVMSLIKTSVNAGYPASFFTTPALTDRLAFYDPIIVGDSGNPIFCVIGNELILLSTFHGSGSGPFYGGLVSELNSMITTLDARQGVSTGHTVTEYDFSSYSTY
jgi:hypothetical protein